MPPHPPDLVQSHPPGDGDARKTGSWGRCSRNGLMCVGSCLRHFIVWTQQKGCSASDPNLWGIKFSPIPTSALLSKGAACTQHQHQLPPQAPASWVGWFGDRVSLHQAWLSSPTLASTEGLCLIQSEAPASCSKGVWFLGGLHAAA